MWRIEKKGSIRLVEDQLNNDPPKKFYIRTKNMEIKIKWKIKNDNLMIVKIGSRRYIFTKKNGLWCCEITPPILELSMRLNFDDLRGMGKDFVYFDLIDGVYSTIIENYKDRKVLYVIKGPKSKYGNIFGINYVFNENNF